MDLKRTIGICVVVVTVLASMVLGKMIFAPEDTYAAKKKAVRKEYPPVTHFVYEIPGNSNLGKITNFIHGKGTKGGLRCGGGWYSPKTDKIYLIFSR